MVAGVNPGAAISRWVADRRANKIDDPVAKLRYLQGAMARYERSQEKSRRRNYWRWVSPAIVAILLILPAPTVSDEVAHAVPLLQAARGPGETAAAPLEKVWLVEETKSYETYSNGLRIENRYTVGNEKRLYPVYEKNSLQLVAWRSEPVGIIYHTTESHQAPWDPEHNRRLRRVGRWTLEYVQSKQAYHFVIDRFGRVQRVVQESDLANHAGFSVWADSKYAYVNLNPSFFGISFETETERTAEGATITSAQAYAAKVLTQMLRSKYGIPAENCVTHAQVSVYSRAMRVGNHVDWAANFPFASLGLGDNYSRPHAAVAVFGFDYGPDFLRATGQDMWKGLAFGSDQFRQTAATNGVSVTKYREERKKRYQEILTVIEEAASSREQGS